MNEELVHLDPLDEAADLGAVALATVFDGTSSIRVMRPGSAECVRCGSARAVSYGARQSCRDCGATQQAD